MMLQRIGWLFFLLALGSTAPVLASQPLAIQLDIDGPIGPATSDYIHRGLAQAQQRDARLVILRLDTPGGLDSSMREIIKDILASPIPVLAYVAPNGARAASAGTYILYASHIAAMAPATNLGAATPVQIAPVGSPPSPPKSPLEKDKDQEDSPTPLAPSNQDALRNKAVNDAVAYIQGLAKLRGRNAEWAEKAVRQGASLDAGAALEQKVIELLADNIPELLEQIHGREVKLPGKTVSLDTQNLLIEVIEPDWRSRLLGTITNPNIAYLLMLIGVYGLILEFANPGTIVAGVVGAICLLLALYAFQVLPVNYAGLALILLGIALMVAEAFAPSFGALGIGGVIAFAIGSVILIDTEVPGYGINPALIAALTLFSALIFIFVIGMLVRARERPVVSGSEQMVGSIAVVIEDFDTEGRVRAHSELWQARSTAPLQKGQQVIITAMDGLTLHVEPSPDKQGESP